MGVLVNNTSKVFEDNCCLACCLYHYLFVVVGLHRSLLYIEDLCIYFGEKNMLSNHVNSCLTVKLFSRPDFVEIIFC